MPQDQRLSMSRISGAGAGPGSAMRYDGANWKPGDHLKGYAELTMYFSSPLLSTGAVLAPSSVDLDRVVGDPGISVVGNQIHYANSSGLYVASHSLRLIPSTNVVSSDVVSIQNGTDGVMGSMTHAASVGTSQRQLTASGMYYGVGPGFAAASLYCACSGGTNRVYNVPLIFVYIALF